MIRAKTLLASVAAIGIAITAITLNSSHDGFVPETEETSATDALAFSPRPENQPQARALSKLRELTKLDGISTNSETETTVVSEATSPTLVQVTEVAQSDRSSESPTVSNQKRAAQQLPSTDDQTTVSKRQEPVPGIAVDAASVGVPLPVALPKEYRMLRHEEWLRASYGQPDQADDFLQDPAVPNVKRNRARRRINRRNRTRRAASTRRRIRKASNVAKAANANTTKPKAFKPVRHREPFNHNGN